MFLLLLGIGMDVKKDSLFFSEIGKIQTNVMANWIKNILDQLINPDQTGFGGVEP